MKLYSSLRRKIKIGNNEVLTEVIDLHVSCRTTTTWSGSGRLDEGEAKIGEVMLPGMVSKGK